MKANPLCFSVPISFFGNRTAFNSPYDLNNSVTSWIVAWKGMFRTKILVPFCSVILDFFLAVLTSDLENLAVIKNS